MDAQLQSIQAYKTALLDMNAQHKKCDALKKELSKQWVQYYRLRDRVTECECALGIAEEDQLEEDVITTS